jgi:four helix bundle protein
MKIRSHKELETYQLAFEASLLLYQLSKSFPVEERYSLTDQMRRSSRSVCANMAEAFRKRKYPKSFIAKLSDSEAEAAETQVWLEFAHQFGYINQEEFNTLNNSYEQIIGKLVNMFLQPEKWSY